MQFAGLGAVQGASTSVSQGGLPPPAWTPDRCGVGFDGETGCRVCVETCPYEAIRPLTTSAGLRIHIDPGLCQRCGACTSACPASALERAFLPDHELDALVHSAASLSEESPAIVFIHASSRALVDALPSELPVETIELPSLLILNETHLLHALECGARGVVILGQPSGHHFAPHLFENPLRIARATLNSSDADRLTYIEDDGTDESVKDVMDFLGSLFSAKAHGTSDRVELPEGHRDRFATLTETRAATIESAERLDTVPFGDVDVDEHGCTLCGACSRVCPTAAVRFNATGGELSFRGVDCINCGLCEQACPEHVLTLAPGLQFGSALFKRRTLVNDEVVPCRNCGTPHLPKRLLDHSRKTLSRANGPHTLSTSQIDLCPRCRSVEAEISPLSKPQAKGGCGSGQCGCESDKPEPAQEDLWQIGRRGFLSGIPALAGGIFASVTGKAAADNGAERPQPAKRLGMVIDLERCVGCHACTAACKAENHVPLGVFRDWVEEHVLGEYPNAIPYFLPKLCNQCSDPACLRACPTGALFMRSDGIVDMNHDICIGCRACNQACPYGVPFMDPVRGTADKCNFCSHRVDEGLNPACVDVCPSQCRIFGDLNDPDSAPSRALQGKPHQVLRQELGLGPNVRYLGLPAELDR